MHITTVGIDLAKNVFHAVGHDAQGREKMKKRLSRPQVLKHFVNLPRCLVGMEACAGAHYFARELTKLGHEVKLIPPQYVKAYVRGQMMAGGKIITCQNAMKAQKLTEKDIYPSVGFVPSAG